MASFVIDFGGSCGHQFGLEFYKFPHNIYCPFGSFCPISELGLILDFLAKIRITIFQPYFQLLRISPSFFMENPKFPLTPFSIPFPLYLNPFITLFSPDSKSNSNLILQSNDFQNHDSDQKRNLQSLHRAELRCEPHDSCQMKGAGRVDFLDLSPFVLTFIPTGQNFTA